MNAPHLVPAMFGLSGWELIIILVVAVLLFGRRLPEIMRGMGSSVKEFKKGMDEATAPPPAIPQAPPAAAPPPPVAPSGAVARDMAPPAESPPKA